MAICTTDSGATGAVNEVGLTAGAANTIQVDCTSAGTKVGIAKCYCICNNVISGKCQCYQIPLEMLVNLLTFHRVTQLSTHHSGISASPGVITHSAPHIVHTDLHSAFIWNVTTYQPQLTSCAWSYGIIRSTIIFLYPSLVGTTVLFLCSICSCLHLEWHGHIGFVMDSPSHPTPASAECWQLWVRIGLLEHSSS